jgi:HSP20 family protein
MRFDPFADIANFDPMAGFGDLLRDFRVRPNWPAMQAEPRIRMDVSESDAAYTVRAEIPGARKEDIKVSVDGNMVTISAETRHEKEEKSGEKVVRRERYYGQQTRSFSVAQEVDQSKSSARYQDGILELTLPKKPGGNGARQIAIN